MVHTADVARETAWLDDWSHDPVSHNRYKQRTYCHWQVLGAVHLKPCWQSGEQIAGIGPKK